MSTVCETSDEYADYYATDYSHAERANTITISNICEYYVPRIKYIQNAIYNIRDSTESIPRHLPLRHTLSIKVLLINRRKWNDIHKKQD